MVKNFSIVLKNLQQVQYKLRQKEQFKKQPKNGDLTGNKIADKITSVSKRPDSNSEIEVCRVSSKDVGRVSPKDVPKKDTYLQKKDNKLLLN